MGSALFEVSCMKTSKLLALVGAMAIPVAGAHAISFSNFLINGVAPPAGNPSAFGSNGVSFSIPDHFLVGIGVKTLTLNYRVTATPGNVLDTFSIFPVGTSKKGNVSIVNSHVNGSSQIDNYSFSGGASLTSLPSQTNIPLFVQKPFYDVSTVITLTGNAADSVNKVTIYSVSYTEAVPEPASMAALALGFGTMLARRNKRNKNS
jgi:hypothetical protein